MFEPYLTPSEIKQVAIEEPTKAELEKRPKRTPKQIEAIYDHGQNILVSASAGSGKTFVMVERIVDMLKRGVSIQQLFISTFTVKAAGELKERLEEELSELIPKTKRPEVRQHLSLQLAGVQTADIGTMDAFTQKLLKEHGYLLGISPQFRILQDETERDNLMQEIFDDLFEDYSKGKDALLFQKLVRNFVGPGKTVRGFRQRVYQIYNFLQSTDHPKNWLEQYFLPKTADKAELLEEKRQEGLVVVERLDQFLTAHLNFEAQYFPKAKYLTNVVEACGHLAQVTLATDLEDMTKAVEAVCLLATGTGLTNLTRKAETKDIKEAYNNARKPLVDDLKNWLTDLQQTQFILTHQDGARELLELLKQFMLDFTQQFLEKKKAEGVFEFSDISHFAIEILTDNPQVRQLYQDRYAEVMVDEYQDTNHTQERMLELLSKDNNRFMVGDIKQSIYRFRQADPTIFNDKFKLYQSDSSQGKLILLKENFRSKLEVVEATNKIFERLMDEQVGDIQYDQTHKLIAGSDDKNELAPENIAQFLIYDTDQETDDDDALEAGEIQVVAKEIIRLHKVDKVPFKDIALLVRSRDSRIEQIFDQHGIPLVSDKGQGSYLQSVDVMVMLDTLRAIDNPLKDYSLVALLKSPMFYFNEDDLARISLQDQEDKPEDQPPLSFYEKLLLADTRSGNNAQLISQDLAAKLRSFRHYLEKWQSYAKGHSLYDLIWLIYKDRLYYDYVGFLSNGERRQVNLYALALRAHQFEQGGFKSLGRFIKMIDRILASQHDLADVDLPAPKDAVNLMTIHKSKGLQFPYVFILNMTKKFNEQDQRSPIIISRKHGVGMTYLTDLKEEVGEQTKLPQVLVTLPTTAYQANKKENQLANLSEQMRLLYVAMTRAKQKLYLVGKGSREKLETAYLGQLENNFLPVKERMTYKTYQDWVLAIKATYGQASDCPIEVSYVTDADLTPDQIGSLQPEEPLSTKELTDNRQSEDIKTALDVLENVEHLNQTYQRAINLPTLVTPSQIKTFYQPVLEEEGMAILQETKKPLTMDWPSFGQVTTASPTAIGSALHELMQRLPLVADLNLSHLQQALAETKADQLVKDCLDLTKILSFFSTDLGQTLLTNADRVVREAPFAMLEKDEQSGEEFVIRGIIDGFVHLDKKIILFDYKTDKYQKVSHMVERYRQQMGLYAKALQRSYGKPVESYLILLGGETVQVAKLD